MANYWTSVLKSIEGVGILGIGSWPNVVNKHLCSIMASISSFKSACSRQSKALSYSVEKIQVM